MSAKKNAEILDKRIKELSTKRDNVTRFVDLKKEIQTTAEKFNAAQDEVRRLSEEIKRTENPTRKLQNEFERARETARKLKEKLGEQSHTLSTLRSDLDSAGVSTKNLAKENKELAREIELATEKKRKFVDLDNQRQSIKGRREQNLNERSKLRGQIVDAAAMGMVLAAPIRSAVEFEGAMADVRKTVDFDTPQQFKAMEKDITAMSRKIPIAASGLASIVAAGGQAGIARKDLKAFAEDAATMGIAFDISADEAGQTMAEWRAAFNMSQEDVRNLADKVNHLGNVTAASSTKISEVVRRIGPLGEVGGMAAGEIAAMGATLTGMGIGEEVAATGIKNLILTMTAGEAATKAQSSAFAALGLDAQVMAQKMQKDSKGAILEVMGALQALPKERQASIMSQLFGKESIGALAPLLTQLDQLKNNFGEVGNAASYSGSMQKEFDSRSATTGNSMILLQNRLDAASRTIVAGTLPALVMMADGVGMVADGVAAFAEKYPNLTRNAILLGGAFVGVTIASAGLQYSWSILKGGGLALMDMSNLLKTGLVRVGQSQVFVALKTGVAALATKGWTAAQWLFNAAMSANPIGLTIAGITALIAVGYLLIKNWDTVSAWFDGFFKGIISKATAAKDWFVLLWTDPLAAISKFVIKGKEILSGFFNWVRGKDSGSSKSSSKSERMTGSQKFARGGIVTRPTFAEIGEGGDTEVVVPINSSSRARSLWMTAGRMLGMNKQEGASRSLLGMKVQSIKEGVKNGSTAKISGQVYQENNNFHYSPKIYLTGGDSKEFEEAMKKEEDNFTKKIEEWKARQRRVALG